MVAILPFPRRDRAAARRPRRSPAGFTLVEVMVALAIFIIGALGVIEMIGLINNNATVDRALTSARTLVSAKIAKAQTDPWLPASNVTPVACKTPYTGTLGTNLAYQDKSDGFDLSGVNPAGTAVVDPVVITSADTGPVITGKMYHTLSTFEAASQSVLITYTLTFTYRGKDYSVSQSTIRSPDLL